MVQDNYHNNIDYDYSCTNNVFYPNLAEKSMVGETHKEALHLDETDSTNRELWSMIDSNPQLPEGFVLWTTRQTAGRGQGSTTWHSEANKNLCMSVLLRPEFLPPGKQFLLNKCIALALTMALDKLCQGFEFKIKWPNDIYCQDKKIAGTLIENRIQGHLLELSVIGIGINVNQTKFPKEIPNPGSLKMLTGNDFQVYSCLSPVIESIGFYFHQLTNKHENSIHNNYLDKLLGYQEYRHYRHGGKTIHAMITGVNKYGKLILQDKQGRYHEFGLKEIAFIPKDHA